MEIVIVIGDAGLPVLPGVPCIDLAIRLGYPSFWVIFQTVASEMVIERAAIAAEASDGVAEQFSIPIETVSHEALKEMSQSAKCVGRTGETVPYTNVMLVSIEPSLKALRTVGCGYFNRFVQNPEPGLTVLYKNECACGSRFQRCDNGWVSFVRVRKTPAQ